MSEQAISDGVFYVVFGLGLAAVFAMFVAFCYDTTRHKTPGPTPKTID